jgi:hypothetical protein
MLTSVSVSCAFSTDATIVAASAIDATQVESVYASSDVG